ncbi:MAG: MATE family efflux transporter [Bacteroidia bacterium]
MTKVKATYSDIWRISYPIMLGSLAQTILGLTDTAFMGRVGEVELGAVGIASVFYFVLVMLGFGIGIGGQILIARKSGEGKTKEIGIIFDHSLLLLVGFSVFLFVFIRWCSPFIFDAILNSENVKVAANTFIAYRCWGIIGVMITVAFRSFYTGIATTRIITYSSFLMTSINVLLGYVLIFGHFGFPAMGIAGAGLASAISETITAIYLLIYTYFKKEFLVYQLFRFLNSGERVFLKVMNLSAPIMLQHLISMGAWFLFFVFIEKLGEHALAISNVVRSTYMLLMTPIWGFAAAANSMTSNLIGQEKKEEVLSLLKKICTLSLMTTFIMVLLNVLFPSFILGITTSDAGLISDSKGSFYVVCGAMILFCISFVLFSGVSGTGNTKIAMFMEIGNIFIYFLYVYVCAHIIKTNVEWVWVVEILYWLLMGIFSYVYLLGNHWKKIKL